MQRHCRDPSSSPLQAHFWAGNTSAHADARSEAPATTCPRLHPELLALLTLPLVPHRLFRRCPLDFGVGL